MDSYIHTITEYILLVILCGYTLNIFSLLFIWSYILKKNNEKYDLTFFGKISFYIPFMFLIGILTYILTSTYSVVVDFLKRRLLWLNSLL